MTMPPGPPNEPQGGAVPPGYTPPPGYEPPGGTYPPPGTTPPGYTPPPAGGGYGPPGGGYGPPGGGFGAPGAYGAPGGYSATPGPLAEWPQRALGGLIDFVGPWILVAIVYQISFALGSLFWLAGLGWAFYNAYLNGQTGQSIGKQVAGLKVVGEQTGQVIGGGMGIVRYLAHIIDGVICYVGFLFPLWDAKKQTIADKVMKTVVITVPK